MKYVLGVDIGGTNIKALALNSAGEVLAEINTPTADVGDKHWLANVELARERACDFCNHAPT